MSLVQWNPFRELDELFNRLQRTPGALKAGSDAPWMPAVDISEVPAEYLLKAELPGVKKEDVQVKVENGVLTVSGERKSEVDGEGEQFHRVERTYGSYSRSFSLPDNVQADRIAADYKDGVLIVHLPKTELKQPGARRITVQ